MYVNLYKNQVYFFPFTEENFQGWQDFLIICSLSLNHKHALEVKWLISKDICISK